MEYELIVGLEVHIQMNTNTKLFSPCLSTFGAVPNSQVSYFDFAYPGTLPSLNKQAVIHAIRLCHALHMDISHTLIFDRKHYFYSDLPKGYQITQELYPIGRHGYLEIDGNLINIPRLHIEEDTCKQIHTKDKTLIDYNRAGVPLVEIVTAPDIHSAKEASMFLKELHQIVSFLYVSNGRLEEGSMRCDVNVSIKEKNSSSSGVKVEIKNLNSYANVERAIKYEFIRQVGLLSEGKTVVQETRRFNEKTKQTEVMRLKEDAVDYKCLIDPNIPPIKINDRFIASCLLNLPKSCHKYEREFKELGLSERQISLLTSEKEYALVFDVFIEAGISNNIAFNWINGEIKSAINSGLLSLYDLEENVDILTSLISQVDNKKITNHQAREIFVRLIKNHFEPLEDIDLSENIMASEDEICDYVNSILDDMPTLVEIYKKGKTKIVGYIVGLVNKKYDGNVDLKKTNNIVANILNRR